MCIVCGREVHQRAGAGTAPPGLRDGWSPLAARRQRVASNTHALPCLGRTGWLKYASGWLRYQAVRFGHPDDALHRTSTNVPLARGAAGCLWFWQAGQRAGLRASTPTMMSTLAPTCSTGRAFTHAAAYTYRGTPFRLLPLLQVFPSHARSWAAHEEWLDFSSFLREAKSPTYRPLLCCDSWKVRCWAGWSEWPRFAREPHEGGHGRGPPPRAQAPSRQQEQRQTAGLMNDTVCACTCACPCRFDAGLEV